LKRSPLRDVAGMMRSFHYATHNAMLRQISLTPRPEEELELLRSWAQQWYTGVSATFLGAYQNTIRDAGLLPQDPEQLKMLLDNFLLERAVYEINYELNNRPAWLNVPLQGVIQLMETEP
jgi:maltose alpha-D-glucosyltransferase/alpha-amylase